MRKLWLLLLLFAQTLLAQNKALDSLQLQLSAAKTDESRLAVLKELVNTAFETDLNKALEYARMGVDLADRAGDKNAQPTFYEMKGRMHANMLQLDSATLFFDKAMAGYKAIDNKKGQATTWFKIGWVHKKKQEIDKAMNADMTALALMEELKDQEGIANALGRVSDDLTQQGRLKEALDYAKKSIAICEKNGMREELMYSFFNAGNVSIAMGENAESLAYYDKAIAINQTMNLGDMTFCDLAIAAVTPLSDWEDIPRR